MNCASDSYAQCALGRHCALHYATIQFIQTTDHAAPKEFLRCTGVSEIVAREATYKTGNGNSVWALQPDNVAPDSFVPVLMLVGYAEGLPPTKEHSQFNSVYWSCISALIAAVFVFYRIERYRSLRFLRWLREHREELLTGVATFKGTTFTRTSEVVQYEVCVSMCLIYSHFRTGYCTLARSLAMKILSIVVVSLFGWWSFTGPFVTIQCLVVNLRGGHRVSVEDLLNQLPS